MNNFLALKKFPTLEYVELPFPFLGKVFTKANWYGKDRHALGISYPGVSVWDVMPLNEATTFADVRSFIDSHLPIWENKRIERERYDAEVRERHQKEVMSRQWNDLERFQLEHPCLRVKVVSSKINHLIHGEFYTYTTTYILPAVLEKGFLGWSASLQGPAPNKYIPTEISKLVLAFEKEEYEKIDFLYGITKFHWKTPDPTALKSFLPSINKPLSVSVQEIWRDADARSAEFEKIVFIYDGEDSSGIRLKIESIPEINYPSSPNWAEGDIVRFRHLDGNQLIVIEQQPKLA